MSTGDRHEPSHFICLVNGVSWSVFYIVEYIFLNLVIKKI